MGHQLVCRAVDDGKHPDSEIDQRSQLFADARRLAFAAVAFFIATFATSSSHAQSGPFAGMAGKWAGGGTVTLDDGSTERIRCRAIYAVNGPTLDMSLTCASDAYRFNLQANAVAHSSAISGTWSETSRNIGGSLQGRGGGGNFQVIASAAGFNADIALRTTGNKQSVVIRSDSQFRGASISMSK